MNPLKIIFAGTPAFSLPCLEALYAQGHHICAVFTQPDRPAGRGQKPQASAIKQWAQLQELSIYQPESLKHSDIQAQIAAFKADVMVVVAYGLILPKVVLDTPRLGCINVHASLLPRWRGAAPIQYAIRNGDLETGITIMQMDVGMDSGDILSQKTCQILNSDTSETLFTRLSQMAPSLLLSAIEDLQEGTATPLRQVEENVTYSPKITKLEAQIDWQQTSQQIWQNIRAFYPWPIAYTSLGQNNIKIHQAHPITDLQFDAPAGSIVAHREHDILIKTGDGVIAITHWQWPNQATIAVHDWLTHKATQAPLGSILQ